MLHKLYVWIITTKEAEFCILFTAHKGHTFGVVLTFPSSWPAAPGIDRRGSANDLWIGWAIVGPATPLIAATGTRWADCSAASAIGGDAVGRRRRPVCAWYGCDAETAAPSGFASGIGGRVMMICGCCLGRCEWRPQNVPNRRTNGGEEEATGTWFRAVVWFRAENSATMEEKACKNGQQNNQIQAKNVEKMFSVKAIKGQRHSHFLRNIQWVQRIVVQSDVIIAQI